MVCREVSGLTEKRRKGQGSRVCVAKQQDSQLLAIVRCLSLGRERLGWAASGLGSAACNAIAILGGKNEG